jgi:metal-dependent amidase/aminoacylase/carboxypeptidase family protein
MKAGEAYNVIPDTAEVAGTFRALRMDTFERTMKRIDEIAASVASAYRCNTTVNWEVQPAYPPTINAPEAWTFAAAVASECEPSPVLCAATPIRFSCA